MADAVLLEQSGPSSPVAPSTAKATARCERGCAWAGCAPPGVGCCGSWASTACSPVARRLTQRAAQPGHRSDHHVDRRGTSRRVHCSRPPQRRVRRHLRRAPGDPLRRLEPVRQGVRHSFEPFAKNVAQGLAVRHDHGSRYMSDAFQQELSIRHMIASIVRRSSTLGRAPRMLAAMMAASNFAHSASLRLASSLHSDDQANQPLRDFSKSSNANRPWQTILNGPLGLARYMIRLDQALAKMAFADT